ncbi:Detected protein of unknown function [Hibiscus syriacus]|uniref:Uncharacterized protein n=1 Tax=Hibiscus syriacus TaxID=106335 RepID=A0A6A2YGY8_HIBSY|nr:Detected protein of unknown function [Hibiscus syriacus]
MFVFQALSSFRNGSKQSETKLPPGPRWLPIFANLFDLERTGPHLLLKLDANQYFRRVKTEELIENVRKSCPKGDAINIGQVAFDATINLLFNTIFSVDLVDPNSSQARGFRQTFWDIMEDAGKPNLAYYFPLLRKIDPQCIRRRMTVHFGKLLTLFGNMFDERSQSRKSNCFNASNDVLDTLIDIVEYWSEIK